MVAGKWTHRHPASPISHTRPCCSLSAATTAADARTNHQLGAHHVWLAISTAISTHRASQRQKRAAPLRPTTARFRGQLRSVKVAAERAPEIRELRTQTGAEGRRLEVGERSPLLSNGLVRWPAHLSAQKNHRTCRSQLPYIRIVTRQLIKQSGHG